MCLLYIRLTRGVFSWTKQAFTVCTTRGVLSTMVMTLDPRRSGSNEALVVDLKPKCLAPTTVCRVFWLSDDWIFVLFSW